MVKRNRNTKVKNNISWLRKILLQSIVVLCFVTSIGCRTQNSNDLNYDLRCNATSAGRMAETKEGFFVVVDSILYYADKTDVTHWVAVCNKPDCLHSSNVMNLQDIICNGYTIQEPYLLQEGNHLYGICAKDLYKGLYVFELSTDGSGIQLIQELSKEEQTERRAYGQAIFADQMVVYYGTLDEFGTYQKKVIALREQENGTWVSKTLYKETNLEQLDATVFVSANLFWTMRGEDVLYSSLSQNHFLRVGEDTLEELPYITEDNAFGSYLSKDCFLYYKANEGFYQVDNKTQTTQLLFANQLEDAWGYVLTEEYLIECNRFEGYKPKEAYLKFYNGEQWVDVFLPEEVKHSDGIFYPVACASDRIFLMHSVAEEHDTIQWYTFMIKEQEPTLMCIGTIPNQ